MTRAARATILLLLCFGLLWAQAPTAEELQYLSSVLPLVQENSWSDAQAKLQEGLKQYPHSAVLMNALGMTYERQAKKDEAIKAYQQAIDWLPTFAAAQLHLASLLATGGNCQQAVSLFLSVTRETNDAGALAAAGIGLAQCKSYRDAASVLEKVHAAQPGSDAATFNLALARYENREFDAALQALNEISKPEVAKQPEVAFLRGKLMFELKQAGGTDLMAGACRARPAEDFCNDTAIALMRGEHFREAEDLLEGSLATLGDLATVRSTLGLAQFRLGRYKEAIASYEKAMELDPAKTAAREGLGFLLYMTGDLEQARAVVEKGIEKSGDDFYLEYLRALILYRLDKAQWAGATESLARAIELERSFAPAYFLRGKIALEEGKWDSALGDFQSAVKLDSKYAPPYYKMSQIYQRQGRTQEAEAARQRFAELGSRREEEVLAAQAQNQLMPAH